MELDRIFSNRYRILHRLEDQDFGLVAVEVYLAENLEIPTSSKPLCIIYCWQIGSLEEFAKELAQELAQEAIAATIYEIGQQYTLAPKVRAFFYEENYYCLVRDYLEGYAYLEDFRLAMQQCLGNLKGQEHFPEEEKQDEPIANISNLSTIKAAAITPSLAKIAQIKIPIKLHRLNRRQLLRNAMINLGAAIAGFYLAIALEKKSSQPLPIAIVESTPIPEPPKDPIKRGEKAFRDDLGNGIVLEMVRIPSGSFLLGSPLQEIGRKDNESPLVEVRLKAFYMAKFAITQEQWLAIMGSNAANFRENLEAPMENVSWLEAQDFCRKLAARSPHAHAYRLPSEAEWEYACRAGTNTAYHFGDSPTQLGDYAWFADNANKRSQPIGQKVPNPWGLSEMHGGVWEWCEDIWHDNLNGVPADGTAWLAGDTWRRVRKGGSWSNEAKLCRAASRDWHGQGDRYKDIGFRVVISTSP